MEQVETKVDVLAVMESDAAAAMTMRAIVDGEGTEVSARQRSDAARAAIAELIEAAREGSATLGHIYHTTPLHPELEQYAHDGYQRLDAALARVGGGK